MRLHENIDFTTLTWVKPELDETLRQARNALQNYVEEGESPGELRTCSDLLHQVQGTLRMVELYGAAMVAEEMEQLSRALIAAKVENRDNAYAVLMQGIVQLPDYLERLQSGHRDIPIVLLPLLNQLRESRGEKGLSESVLFSPDLSRPLPPSAQGPQSALEPKELSRRAEALHGLFQSALLRWLKDDSSPSTIRDLTDVCEQLVPITWAEPARRLFWVAAGTLDALARNAFPISTPLKQALARVEREIKRLAEGGDAAFRSDPPIELTKQLLYFVAHEGSDTGRIGEIRNVFGLSGSEPSEAEMAHARGSLSGNNRALLETVAVAIKEDLLRVKDALDLHLRTPGASLAELSVQVEALDRVADTLGMLGLGVPRRVVQDQRSAINDVVTGQRKGDEETLLDIAGALLYVEAALDDQVDRLGKEEVQATESVAAAPSNESRRLLEVLVKEAIINFGEARQAFVAFVETHWDHAQLAEVPRLLTEVSGALRILNISEPADCLIGVRQFTDNELLRRRQVPNGQQMDRLADALASLEYFLEALRDRRPNRDQILEVTRQSLAALGYWPLSAENRSKVEAAAPAAMAVEPATAAAVVAAATENAPAIAIEISPPAVSMPEPEPAAPLAELRGIASEATAPELPASPTLAAQPQQPQPSPVASTANTEHALVPGFDGASSEEIDDEIREVFLEEFEEEIENLAQLLPAWRRDPANAEFLRPIRRVFHTLKGSGRLVGAKSLGEFSWKVESLLNRVLDGSRPASPQVLALVQLSLDNLPYLRAALQGEVVHADLEGIQAIAERLTAGEEVSYAAAPAPAAEIAAPVQVPSAAVEPEPVPELEAPLFETEAVAPGEELLQPVFSIDPVLLEILRPEVAGHLEVVDAWLAACAARGPQQVTDPLLRSIHTMNGAFAMTEVVMITEVTAPLEGFVKRSLAHHLNPGAEGVALVADAVAAIRETIIAIGKPRPVLPHFDALSARALALRDALPDALLPSVPVHVEEETAVMPQVVVLEAADVSAIPEFEILAPMPAEQATVAAEPAPVEVFESVELDLGTLDEAPFEAEEAVEAAAAAIEPLPPIEAPSPSDIAPVDGLELEEARVEAPLELEEVGIEASLEVEDAGIEAPLEFEEVGIEASLEAEASPVAEFEVEQFLVETPLDFETAPFAASEDEAIMVEALAEADQAPAAAMQAEELLLEAPTAFEVEPSSEDATPVFSPEPMLLEQSEVEVAADTAEAEPLDQVPETMDVLYDEQIPILEASVEPLAEHQPEAEAVPEAALDAVAVEPSPEDAFTEEEEQVAHAELPESEMLSLEAFLRQESEQPAPFVFDEAPEAFDTPSFDSASLDTAAMDAEPVPPPATPEPVAEAFDTALAGMISAYPDAPEATAAAASEPAPESVVGAPITVTENIEEGIFSAEELAGADELLENGAPVVVAEAELEQPPVALSDEYYGLSLAELEALTAPDSDARPPAAVEAQAELAEALPEAVETALEEVEIVPEAVEFSQQTVETPAEIVELESAAEELPPVSDDEISEPKLVAVPDVEADGFADLPTISDLPAWAGASEENIASEAMTETPVVQLADAEESPEAEPAEAQQFEPVEEITEIDAEVSDLPVEDEPALQQAQAEEIAEIEAEFSDDPVEDEPAPQPVPAKVLADIEPIALARPSVPMALDPVDPETALDVTDLDTELLDLFLEESNDILDHSDGMLARLRDRADDRESIINLQRDLHTLKGGARMAGIYAVGELGHAMESLLESVAEGRQRLDATGVVVLERGFDRLHGMVARIGERKSIALPAGLIAQVEALSEGKSLSSVSSGETQAPVQATSKGAVLADSSSMVPLSAPMDELGAEDELFTGVRAPQEQVRIRADLLDRLVNYAGEVAIYRARLEQQLGAFRANLGELDQTTTRLREQLRRLDIETEAQIVARYQREGESDDERFDPLELDRFTNQQQLTRGLNESANDLVNLQGVLDELTRQYETLLLQQSRVSSDLQEGLMRTRMVPFDALVPRLRRVLRQAAIDTGKQVQLKVDGASGEMDRNVLDRMTAPLEHMLRNAMAHGLELPEERRKARKGEEGVVRIAVQREGSEVVLKVSDDGRGLNKQAIREKALERGLLKADAEISDEALYGMILESGFSTAQTVSRLSGRGVGMDVVYSEIRQLGGTLQIKSVEGKGSEFVIRLPFTLAVTQAVFVKIGDTSFAVPIASVQGVGRIARADLDKQLATESPVFSYAGEDYAIHDLGNLIGHAPAKAQESLQMPLLLARSGDLRTAISIDQVLGSREIVVKPVGPQVNSVPGIFGATIMGDGRVVVILDVAPLVRRHMAVVRDTTPVLPLPVVAAHRVPVVMVVDDSITMRKVTGRVLERNNMEVLTAKDGVDAVEKMAERVPDLVLLDIEMPRMDGYEVAQNMRSDPRLKDVPIIMITSRTGDKHRQRAMDIGVNRYLGKPYQEPELMRNVFEMLGMEPENG